MYQIIYEKYLNLIPAEINIRFIRSHLVSLGVEVNKASHIVVPKTKYIHKHINTHRHKKTGPNQSKTKIHQIHFLIYIPAVYENSTASCSVTNLSLIN